MTESSDYESAQVFIGVDVGKDTHHAVAVNRSGKCVKVLLPSGVSIATTE